ncbi:MAG TPA: DsbA family protein [Oligoflexia bacterium]|mgnify:CR=1 FL=1|nr:DsbA family protein [Oligoflexia bacterium]HMP26806.1 DsbA family protein [Oligoflexia bacterium]
MKTALEIFYSFQSPYSYLALDKIYQLGKDFEVELIWQPFSAKASGQSTMPQQIMPEKLSYLFEDTKRIAEAMNIPLVFPEGWPENEFEPGRMTRGALVANDMGILMEYNYKVFHRWWGLGQNPNDETFLSELCEELDVELGEFLSKISSSDTRERVKGIYKRGKNIGVYDTPTIVIGNDRYVGYDKIYGIREMLSSKGLKA